MRLRLNVRQYCEGVFAAAIAVVALFAGWMHLDYVRNEPLTFSLLTLGVVLAEAFPVKIPRRGNDEEITLSGSFAIALLLAGGLGPALLAQSLASVIQDRMSGKPWWRVRFNVGQYTLSMIAAMVMLRLLSADAGIGSAHPFQSADLPAVLLSATAFFLVNTGLVGVAVALYQETPVLRYLRKDMLFVINTAGVLLLLAPIVIAATAYSPFLIPLFAGPILAMHNAIWKGARNEYAARHDSLTGLPNRTTFREAVENAIADDDATDSVLLMDLDRFKEVNDTLGHHYGDLLLRQVAERVRGNLSDDDRIARLGGDEFAILTRDRTRVQAKELAHRILTALRPPFELEGIGVDVQASIGIASFPDDGLDVESLLQKADVAMYCAKADRSNVALYDEQHDHHSPRKLALTADLRLALQDDGIVAWYQPELDLEDGTLSGVEALVRWQHPQLGLLAPAAFLEIAERTNLIKPLTQRVIETTLCQLVRWREMDIDLVAAVNISAAVLIDDKFTEQVLDTLAQAGIPPQRLKLEVTESTLMADPEVARVTLQRLSSAGVEISIDDFGTGYSSLAYLAGLPVAEVKIDRSFVGRMGVGTRESIIVSSTIDLAHHLGMRAVAEGVESGGSLTTLRQLGCDVAQGYAICPPLSGEAMTKWLTGSGRAALTEPLRVVA